MENIDNLSIHATLNSSNKVQISYINTFYIHLGIRIIFSLIKWKPLYIKTDRKNKNQMLNTWKKNQWCDRFFDPHNSIADLVFFF